MFLRAFLPPGTLTRPLLCRRRRAMVFCRAPGREREQEPTEQPGEEQACRTDNCSIFPSAWQISADLDLPNRGTGPEPSRPLCFHSHSCAVWDPHLILSRLYMRPAQLVPAEMFLQGMQPERRTPFFDGWSPSSVLGLQSRLCCYSRSQPCR